MRDYLDKAIAGIGTVGLHAVLILLLFSNIQWSKEPPPPVRTTLQATVVSDEAFRLAEDALEQTASPAPEPPEPEPDLAAEQAQREREQAQRQQREREESARKQREADAARQRELDEKATREKAEREAAAKQQREAEEKATREAAEQKQREREAAERRKREEAERRQREEAERKKRAEEQRQRELESQLRDALAAEEERAGAVDAGLLTQYIEQIRQKVERNWIRPPGVADGIRCEVAVRQLRNGEVVSVRVVDCAGGEVLIRSIETAVLKASPLPLPQDASLFEPNLRFPFKTGE